MTDYDRGAAMFKRGAKRVPFLDAAFMKTLATRPALKPLEDWLAGWDYANLAEPVPGMPEFYATRPGTKCMFAGGICKPNSPCQMSAPA
jgi:hypothetical protein